MVMLDPSAGLVLNMKIALYVGLILAAPIWLYQLWAFVAPGLHRNERKLGLLVRRLRRPRFSPPAR